MVGLFNKSNKWAVPAIDYKYEYRNGDGITERIGPTKCVHVVSTTC